MEDDESLLSRILYSGRVFGKTLTVGNTLTESQYKLNEPGTKDKTLHNMDKYTTFPHITG
jgi:hypothetical protein